MGHILRGINVDNGPQLISFNVVQVSQVSVVMSGQIDYCNDTLQWSRCLEDLFNKQPSGLTAAMGVLNLSVIHHSSRVTKNDY